MRLTQRHPAMTTETTHPTSHHGLTAKRSLRILYADDMRELRDVARIAFSRAGHKIECVSDGQQALDLLIANPHGYDLVISDHHMPILNGIGLISRLRELPYTGKVLIFCSELSPAVSDTYTQLRADRILYKPVFPAELRKVLDELFPTEPAH